MLYWARALLGNGQARYHDALHAAQQAVAEPLEPGPAKLALPELIEAAAKILFFIFLVLLLISLVTHFMRGSTP